ncbi:MAG: hypothetical protein IAI50_04020 [Candidatus Eremiobacteraeota bacterium]|nr:hypothetical protein [Candidatus Eremiobacteraeota bacterium]
MVAKIELLSPATIYAAAQRSVAVRFRVSNAADGSALAITLVHAEIAAGDATFNGTSKAVDAITGTDGVLELDVAAGAAGGPLLLHLTIGATALDIQLRLVRAPERPLVVGVATIGVGSVPGLIEAPDNGPNGTLSRRGAVSVYGSGAVAANTRGTIAYSSADSLEQDIATGPFVDDPNDRPFPTYGDASTRYSDALSRDHLFARVENGASSALLGEFYAQGGTSDVAGGYNILVNGLRLQTQGARAGGGVFSARNDVAFDRVVLSPTGLGIANRILQPDIVVGSDIVTLVSLDRRSGAVVAQQVLGRGTDYVLDYASGLLRFVNILLPYDDELDPQVVVVQYQYGGAAARSSMIGANGSYRLARSTADAPRLDSWYLNDSTGVGNLSIFGEALRGSSPGLTWSLSHEHSQGIAPVSTVQYGDSGDRYRAMFASHGGPLTFDLQVDATGAGYANPYGAYSTPGLLSLNFAATQRLSRIASLELSYLSAKNDLPANASAAAITNADTRGRIALRVKPSSRLSYHAGVIDEAANGNGVVEPITSIGFGAVGGTAAAGVITPATDPLSFPGNLSTIQYTPGAGHGLLLDSGISWMFAPRVTLSLDERTALSTTTDPYDPPGTDVALEFVTGPDGKAFIRQHWNTTSSGVLAATQQATAFSGTAASSTTAGFEQQIGTTTVETGYAVDRTASGTDLYQAIGARRTITLGPKLTGDAFAQVGQEFESTTLPLATAATPDFLVFGTSLTYTAKPFTASAQYQERTGFNSGSTMTLGIAGPVSPSVSLFGSMSTAYTQAYDTSNIRAGASYRPANNDRAVTLFSVDSETGNITNYDEYVTNVAQLQELYRPSRRTEFGASLAYKITGDSTFAPRTTIYGLSVDQRVGPRMDFGTELHRTGTAPLNGAQATGLAIEAGYRIGDQLRLAGGYNFSGFADPAAAISPTHHGLYATMSTYIDRIFGWGKDVRP